MRVLYVEDDDNLAFAVEKMLSQAGHVCDRARSGAGGVKLGQEHEYDVILLDVMLPDIDGYEVLRQLQEVGVETPVLIQSGLVERDRSMDGLGFGVDDYLIKPFNRDELISQVEKAASRGGRATPAEALVSLPDVLAVGPPPADSSAPEPQVIHLPAAEPPAPEPPMTDPPAPNPPDLEPSDPEPPAPQPPAQEPPVTDLSAPEPPDLEPSDLEPPEPEPPAQEPPVTDLPASEPMDLEPSDLEPPQPEPMDLEASDLESPDADLPAPQPPMPQPPMPEPDDLEQLLAGQPLDGEERTPASATDGPAEDASPPPAPAAPEASNGPAAAPPDADASTEQGPPLPSACPELAARIVGSDSEQPIDCTIVSLSSGGAVLDVYDETVDCPDVFMLAVVGDKSYRCESCWRHAGKIGVKFA